MHLLALMLILRAGPPPVVKPLAVMAGDGVVFVTLPTPADMRWPMLSLPAGSLPARIALEQAARPWLGGEGMRLEWLARDPAGVPTIEFVGRHEGPLPPRLRLRYHADGPRSAEAPLAGVEVRKGGPGTMRTLLRRAALERLSAQELLSGGHGWFAYARKAMAKEWKLTEPASLHAEKAEFPPLYELASGAGSLDEALALGRVEPTRHDPALRDIPIGDISGPVVPAHDWKTLMAGKKPRPEPLAACVPHDNWYFAAPKLAALAELADTLESWGNPLRFASMGDRDARLLERYQAQLGLPIKRLAKAVPAKLVRAVALTGSDLFWAEGTDVTVIVDTPDPDALEALLREPAYGKARFHRYRTQFIVQRGTQFRATAPERVIVSNSLPALRRVLDAMAGRAPSLSSCLDFQYMRTAFARDEKQEDAFVFLGDDFIRSLVSPATRIKAMRRAHTRGSLLKVSHAALVSATLHGKMPVLPREMYRRDEDFFRPPTDASGNPIAWEDGEASSPIHGTLSRGTPLVDLNAGDVTPQEKAAYERFRSGYDQLWRTFIDPVGIRMKSDAAALRVEAYMLPLAHNERYRQLREWTRGQATQWDPRHISPGTVAQLRLAYGGIRGGLAFQVDDSPDLPGWTESFSTMLHYPERWKPSGKRLPMTVGFRDEAQELLKFLEWIAHSQDSPLLLKDKATERKRGGTTAKRIPLNLDRLLRPDAGINPKSVVKALQGPWWAVALLALPILDAPPKALHIAEIGKAKYLSFDGKELDDRIDASKGAPDEKGEPAAAGLFLSRKPPRVAALLDRLLEGQVRGKALAANTMWQALYEAGAVTPAMSDDERRRVALKLWGFVPSSPDGSTAVWDKETRQVRNARHGTWERPATHAALDPASPFARFLHGMESLTADLRFREDGIHTVIAFSHAK